MTALSSPSEHDALDVEMTLADDHVCVHLVGELDLATAPLFDEALALAQDQGPPTLVVDLARLTFIDSSGLNRLVLALKRQRERGGDIVLRSPGASTRRVLDMMGLTQLFTVVA